MSAEPVSVAAVGYDAADPALLHVMWRRFEGITLTIAGELDRWSYPQLSRLLDQVEEGGPGRVELDFSSVQLLDSAAARALRRRREEMHRRGCTLVIRRANPWVCRVLALLQMQDLLASPVDALEE
ncbi:MAG: STAS domain-containing protein [Armatimonadota bacterium]|nr:STAS domain-containing protein [Armatimonadota bacterium]